MIQGRAFWTRRKFEFLMHMWQCFQFNVWHGTCPLGLYTTCFIFCSISLLLNNIVLRGFDTDSGKIKQKSCKSRKLTFVYFRRANNHGFCPTLGSNFCILMQICLKWCWTGCLFLPYLELWLPTEMWQEIVLIKIYFLASYHPGKACYRTGKDEI